MSFVPKPPMSVATLSEAARAKGYWIRVSSPFFSPAQGVSGWHIGINPHGTTGWNGRADHPFSGDSWEEVVGKASQWLQEQ